MICLSSLHIRLTLSFFIGLACKTLQVCSKECQAAAWAEHKGKCEQLSGMYVVHNRF